MNQLTIPYPTGIHFARLKNSARLQRVKAYLEDGREHSTLDIIHHAFVAAVNSCATELRCNGFAITCQRRGDIWFYRMII